MATELTDLIADVREQVLYLQELGVEAIGVNLGAISATKIGDSAGFAFTSSHLETEINSSDRRSERLAVETQPRPIAPRPTESYTTTEKTPAAERPVAGSRLAALPSLSNRKTMPFFDKYNPDERPATANARNALTVRGVATLPSLPEPTETIEQIRAEIGENCTRCKLCDLGRSRVVNSIGNFDADLMFVGEAPGADEDAQGEPFVGKAGQLLTDIIEKGLQIPRKNVFIGNINRCRPPGNRAPEPDESAVCKPFLQREIAVVRPRVIVVLGATAAQNLLETKVPISKLRGNFHDYLGTKVMPTFHPAYLLRDPHKKREVWEDMKMVKGYLTTTGG